MICPSATPNALAEAAGFRKAFSMYQLLRLRRSGLP
jgi:hypothetical protein